MLQRGRDPAGPAKDTSEVARECLRLFQIDETKFDASMTTRFRAGCCSGRENEFVVLKVFGFGAWSGGRVCGAVGPNWIWLSHVCGGASVSNTSNLTVSILVIYQHTNSQRMLAVCGLGNSDLG